LTYDACAIPIFPLQMQVDHLALDMMLRGIPVDPAALLSLAEEVEAAKVARYATIQRWVPAATTKLPNSNKQMKELFVTPGYLRQRGAVLPLEVPP
jgi:hypothetical protein